MKISKFKFQILLWIFIGLYVSYFSYFTVLRYKTLYASYYDLGIMHQTVFNTYRAITNGDPSRILELTDPAGSDQIKRMAIHNDPLLALLAVFYFIQASPATLLVLQSVMVGLGAYFVFQIAQLVLAKTKHKDLLSLTFAFCYLLNPLVQWTNIYEFHMVAFATTFLLAMFYFFLKREYLWSFLFFVLSLLTKEQVALTAFFFGLYTLYSSSRVEKNGSQLRSNNMRFGLLIMSISLVWFALSMLVIIPYFRGGHHFALSYYDGATRFINPLHLLPYLARQDIYSYFVVTLGPLGFLSLLSPLQLFIVLPEFAINLLSTNANLRNIIYHYTAVLTPFIFISAIYGARVILNLLLNLKRHSGLSRIRFWSRFTPQNDNMLGVYILSFALLFAFLKGPLPFALNANIHPFRYPQTQRFEAEIWSKKLADENLKVSTTGQLSPFFTSRRYFYTFSSAYPKADYLVIRPNEIYNYPEKDQLVPVYEKLKIDPNFKRIYQHGDFEVYKNITKN